MSESAVLTVVAITATPTRTRTATPTRSATPSPSRTIAPPPYTPSSTATASPSKTATSTPTSTKSPSPSPSLTPSPTSSATSSATPTATPTPQPSTADFLVSSANELSAYRFDGSLIASIDIPFGQPDRTDTNSARDVIVLPTGDIALFNGGGSPFLSILEQTSGSWQHFQLPGWNTIKTSGSGGIVADGQSIYLTDMPQAGQGLLSLSLKDKTFKRFAQNIAPTDLAIAGDQLYALVNRKNLLVYDTNTLELQNVIRLRRRVRAFALRKSGSIYGVAERGSAIYNFSPTGRLMQVRKLGQGALIDINVSIEDLVLVGAKNGSVILSDPSLKSFAPFTVSDVPAYVEFTN